VQSDDTLRVVSDLYVSDRDGDGRVVYGVFGNEPELVLAVNDTRPRRYVSLVKVEPVESWPAEGRVRLRLHVNECQIEPASFSFVAVSLLVESGWTADSLQGGSLPSTGAEIDSVELGPALGGQSVDFDISSAVSLWRGGAPNHGLMFVAEGLGLRHDSCRFASSRSTTPPRLVVEADAASPTSRPTQSVTATQSPMSQTATPTTTVTPTTTPLARTPLYLPRSIVMGRVYAGMQPITASTRPAGASEWPPAPDG
jgi:hypothetical protein